jgi:hypothetical protein
MKKYWPLIILLACGATFAFGLVQLFELRFQGGDVYPPYSSLRADPLGTMALYESLEKLPAYFVHRDLSANDRLPAEPNTTYLHLAGNQHEWNYISNDLYREIQGFLARGGRLVITFYPRNESYDYNEDNEDNETETNSVKSTPARDKPAEPKKMAKKKNKLTDGDSSLSLEDKWGFHPAFLKLLRTDDDYLPARVLNKTALPLPPVLPWHSGIIFSNIDDSWQIIYARTTNAVVIERKFGRGSVVLVSDSYLVSNEAMTKDCHADLLAWVIGPNQNIYFDEAHLGIVETPGIATLMRQYRLHGLAAGLLLLAGLLIWKNSTSLVPPASAASENTFIAGKDSASGFVNLLRRSVAPAQLLALCFSEWKKTGGPAGKISAHRLQQAEAVIAREESLPGRQRKPLTAYRQISEILRPRNKL